MIILLFIFLKMLALLPQDIIYHISTFMQVEYICDDDDSEDYNTSELFIYNGEGQYYPLFCLYATCKAFGWLLEKEFIHIDTGEFYSNIVTKNIKGKCYNMFYQYNENIYGFAFYKQDEVICQNTWGSDFDYYRFVDGKEIIADDCERPYSDRKKCINCEHCDLLDKVTDYVKAKDPLIKEILSGNHNYDNGNIFMRDIHDISIKSYYIFWLWLKEQNIIQDIVFYLMGIIFSVVPKVFITQ